jgi:hypothetical protein
VNRITETSEVLTLLHLCSLNHERLTFKEVGLLYEKNHETG